MSFLKLGNEQFMKLVESDVNKLENKLLKPISEATYLTTENAWRYRAILRYFYIQHEKLRQYLFPEEVYQNIKLTLYFQDYTEEQLQNDLYQLVQWKNLIPRHHSSDITKSILFNKYKWTAYYFKINDIALRNAIEIWWRYNIGWPVFCKQ